MSTTLPRPTLSFFEKRKLEQQFAEQIPEFTEYHQKRQGLKSTALKVGAVVGAAVGIVSYQRSFQPLTGLFGAAMGLLVGHSATKGFAANSFGVNPTNDAEYERAFNLWVYYEHNPYRKQEDLPVHTIEQRYQSRLAEFREKHQQEYQKYLTKQN